MECGWLVGRESLFLDWTPFSSLTWAPQPSPPWPYKALESLCRGDQLRHVETASELPPPFPFLLCSHSQPCRNVTYALLGCQLARVLSSWLVARTEGREACLPPCFSFQNICMRVQELLGLVSHAEIGHGFHFPTCTRGSSLTREAVCASSEALSA